MLVNFFPMQCNAMSEDSPNAKIKLCRGQTQKKAKEGNSPEVPTRHMHGSVSNLMAGTGGNEAKN